MIKNHKHRRILLLIVIMIIVGIIFTTYQCSDKKLPKYVAEETESQKEELDIENIIVTPFKDSDFSLCVPKDNKKVIDNKKTYFLGELNISITENDYYYQINNISADTFTAGLNGNYEVFTCSYPDTSSFVIVYSLKTDNTNTINVSYYRWDREKVYCVAYETNYELYDKYIEYIHNSIETMKWTKNKPIEDGIVMNYAQNGSFNYAYPNGWKVVVGNNIVQYTSADDSTTMTVELYENKTYFDKLSDLEYTQYLSANKSFFTLSQLSKDKNNIFSISSYSENNQKINVYQKIYANGTYQYFITFYIFESKLTEEVLAMIDNINSYFSVIG